MDVNNLPKAGAAQVKPGGCPPGPYNAVFLGAFQLPPRKDGPDYGPALMLRFRDDEKKAEPSAIVSAAPTLRNACGRILASMLGRPLQAEEVVDWSQFEGQRFALIVVTNKSGTGTTIADVSRL